MVEVYGEDSIEVAKVLNNLAHVLKQQRHRGRAEEMLQRSLKIADACKMSDQHTALFVEMLDVYLWHFEQARAP